MSKFWIYDPSVILDGSKYWQIIPTREMNITEQLNTISRFLIYLAILLILFNRNSVLLLLAIVAIIVIIIYYSLYVNDVNSIKLDINENFVDELNEYVPKKNITMSPIDTITNGTRGTIGINGNSGINGNGGSGGTNGNGVKGDISDKVSYYSSIIDTPNSLNTLDLQTSYIDSNGDYVFGDLKKDSNIYGDVSNTVNSVSNTVNDGTLNDGTVNDGTVNNGTLNDGTVNDGTVNNGILNVGNGDNEGMNTGLTYKMNNKFIDSTCRKPTADNPYANIVFSDYLDAGNIASPCNVDDDELPKKSLELYNSSIFRNVDDVFERENSQRLFYTLPINTVPNKQTEFARWLYDTGPRCKEDTSKCTYYEDPSMTSPRYL
jgi:hypothetical protein